MWSIEFWVLALEGEADAYVVIAEDTENFVKVISSFCHFTVNLEYTCSRNVHTAYCQSTSFMLEYTIFWVMSAQGALEIEILPFE